MMQNDSRERRRALGPAGLFGVSLLLVFMSGSSKATEPPTAHRPTVHVTQTDEASPRSERDQRRVDREQRRDESRRLRDRTDRKPRAPSIHDLTDRRPSTRDR